MSAEGDCLREWVVGVGLRTNFFLLAPFCPAILEPMGKFEKNFFSKN